MAFMDIFNALIDFHQLKLFVEDTFPTIYIEI